MLGNHVYDSFKEKKEIISYEQRRKSDGFRLLKHANKWEKYKERKEGRKEGRNKQTNKQTNKQRKKK